MAEQPLKAGLIVEVLRKAGLLLQVQMNDPELEFTAYTTDSRQLRPRSIFIAYQGVKFDAHGLLPALLAKDPGLGLIVDQSPCWALAKKQPFACLVSDSRQAWSYLAAYRWGQPQAQLRLLGITGTNGKTSTVWFLRQILMILKIPCLTLGTLGVYCGPDVFPATHTTPDPDDLFRSLAIAVERGYQWAIMEVSSHALVQKRLGPLRFDGVAFTSFSRDHLDFHSSMDEYFAAKWLLLSEYRKPGACAWIHSSLQSRLASQSAEPDIQAYGPAAAEGPALDLSYRIEAMELGHSEIVLQQGSQAVRGRLPFGGDFAVANFAAAWALLSSQLKQLPAPASWVALQPVPGRFEPIVAHGLSLIVDYAHTPDALEKTLLKLRELTRGQLWVVFGCGGDRDRGKRPLMGRLAEQLADHVVLTSDNPRSEDPTTILKEIAAGMQQAGAAQLIVDRRSAIKYALKAAVPGDAILIAGKGHEDYQLIGGQRLDFDDRIVAREILQSLS